ncbi:gamma-glutamyltransferase [Chitinophaga pinensis]|uniref:Glutathione hydrolase proenzyme n=1 Tax=Chitinophaga pinensis (strain ATCC 43595 / DSM 2588 / LMG 13176 / NBRC 15968 / NCIMB 11800 / UQM 2034) TaxID=485918 RepID=A0A979G9N3_CHIPD|nr:gamma-glutamyltransferase [Chitinophaga pinensis]ACU63345.1 gamma-glutamyltransferase [Chitinophaga pinensis DSM 2588]
MRKVSLLLVMTLTSTAYAQQRSVKNDAYHYKIEKTITASRGAVVSAHPLASQAGLQMLQQGGNAVDAAIATQLALAVVYPAAGNLGGGGFMVAHLKNGKNVTIDYREKAPGAASRDMYIDAGGNANTALSQDGHLAAGVPGTVAGLFASLPYAKLTIQQLIAPAILLAEKGYAITDREAKSLNRTQDNFKKLNTQGNAFIKATPWKAGDTLLQKDLAATLKRIRDNGKAGFYEGETARLIVAEMQRGHGLMTAADLKAYEAKERTAVTFAYKKYDIVTMPLPSSGGVALQQMMGMVEKYPLHDWGFHSIAAMHVMIEAERRAYADRAKFLGDPDFVKVPVKQLTDPAYLQTRMQDFDPKKASVSTNVPAGNIYESKETTHLSVMDNEGNAVAVTTTLNGGYGSKVVVGGAGFFLNNEMDDFSVKPGVPNMYGLIGAEANAVAPGKRMLSSMTPTIVLKQGKPYIVTGTPGGSTIITSVFQTLLNLLEFNLSAQQAVDAPKFHHQWLPDEVYVEEDFDQTPLNGLKQMGYKIEPSSPIGRVELIRINGKGQLEAVGDKRGDDSAAGY